jgi:Zn-dependent peptidase ImmA (M78 family)/DNA-binding XRE family transcriptional regulator
MSRTPEAKIKPALLVWARNSSGLSVDVAAKKIGVKSERLAAWEMGEARPSIAQLRKAGEVYKRPLAVFFLPEPPKDFRPLSDFRRLPDSAEGGWSPELRVAVRRAEFQQQVALDLYHALGEDPPAAPVLEETPSDPEQFGDQARALLGVSIRTQVEWTTAHEALSGWSSALEDLGVLVLQAQNINLKEMRGFSLSEGPVPAIVLNGGDSASGRVFTILHEFAHLLLRKTGVCDLHDRRDGAPTDKTELFCNAAAASALLPTNAFLKEPAVVDQTNPAGWTDADLIDLARKYSVSREVIVRRLWTHDLTSWDFMQAKIRQFRKEYDDFQGRKERRKGGPSFYRMRVRDYGRSYVRLALDAYHRDEINAAELSDYIEVKLNQLPKLEEELAEAGSA